MKERDIISQLPDCPSCNEPMALVRTWPRVGGLPELNTFECKHCEIIFTEVATGDAPVPQRVSALHLGPYHVQH